MNSRMSGWVSEVLNVPSVTTREWWLAGMVARRLSKCPNVEIEKDAFGNIVARYRPAGAAYPVFALQAHLDHPGYEVVDRLGENRYRAVSYGHCLPDNVKGFGLRFYGSTIYDEHQGMAVSAGEDMLDFKSEEEILVGSFGLWDFPCLCYPKLGVLAGRELDDPLSVALVTMYLITASESGFAIPFDVILTRVEEEDKTGSKELMKNMKGRLAPVIVNVEVSAEKDSGVQGNGVVLRAVDKKVEGTKRMVKLAQEEASAGGFKLQFAYQHSDKAEAMVFADAGYESVTLCLPVKNKHNRADDGRPAPEMVSEDDVEGMCELVERMAARGMGRV